MAEPPHRSAYSRVGHLQMVVGLTTWDVRGQPFTRLLQRVLQCVTTTAEDESTAHVSLEASVHPALSSLNPRGLSAMSHAVREEKTLLATLQGLSHKTASPGVSPRTRSLKLPSISMCLETSADLHAGLPKEQAALAAATYYTVPRTCDTCRVSLWLLPRSKFLEHEPAREVYRDAHSHEAVMCKVTTFQQKLSWGSTQPLPRYISGNATCPSCCEGEKSFM